MAMPITCLHQQHSPGWILNYISQDVTTGRDTERTPHWDFYFTHGMCIHIDHKTRILFSIKRIQRLAFILLGDNITGF